jgi:hypothetical protein
MTAIRVLTAVLMLPWIILLAVAIAMIQIVDGTFFKEGDRE